MAFADPWAAGQESIAVFLGFLIKCRLAELELLVKDPFRRKYRPTSTRPG